MALTGDQQQLDASGLGDVDRLASEAATIAASPDFARAPVMRRLFQFLVDETLAGRGDQLKGYAIAVDGLGRPSDFDAQGDSYPRVQVGRLRRLIDGFYALHPPSDGIRLAIPPGRYRVELERVEQGYRPADAGAGGASSQIPTGDGREQPRRGRRYASAAVVVAALLGMVGGWLIATRRGMPPAAAPIMELQPLGTIRVDPGLEEEVRALLLDGLRRSWTVQIRAARRTGPPDPVPVTIAYRLGGDLTGAPNPALYLRLWRTGPDRLIWSERILLPPDRSKLSDALAPTISALIQPLGVIAARERAERRDTGGLGYACLLRYDHYVQSRNAAEFRQVATCLDQTIERDPTNATALAMAAMMHVDSDFYRFGIYRGGRSEALRLARSAVSVSPVTSVGYHALARLSFMRGQCASAKRNGLRAADLNGFDPVLLIAVSQYLLNCGDDRAGSLLGRALRLDPNLPGRYYGPLVYQALSRDDLPALRAAAAAMDMAPSAQPSFYLLTRAVGLAAAGEPAAAKAEWRRLEEIDPATARDPNIWLVKARIAPPLRAKALAALASAGVIAAPPP